jgi:nucleotide-binding universal stress UspA family protein
MNTFSSILIVTGPEDLDASLIRACAALGSGMEISRVTLLHVRHPWELPPYWMGPPPKFEPSRSNEQERKRLSEAVALAQASFPGKIAIESHFEEGPLVSTIAKMAAKVSADLCCVPRHVSSEYWVDRVPAIVRKTPCSVFVLPHAVALPFERILVPVDFSQASREAFEFAVRLAQRQPKSFVEALHICNVPIGYYKAGQTYESFGNILKQQANEHAVNWMAEIRPAGVTVNWRFEVRDSAASAIVAAAEEDAMNLAVLGGHGLTKPAGALVGHTADTVCSHIRRPFLCVKQKGQVVHLLRAMAQVLTLD